MNKTVEVLLLAGFCLLSFAIGWIAGHGIHRVSLALFFYLLSGCFFLAMFRPRSL